MKKINFILLPVLLLVLVSSLLADYTFIGQTKDPESVVNDENTQTISFSESANLQSEANQAASEIKVQTSDNFDDNSNLLRIFRLINSLNKEADKQQTKGFSKRAEMVRNYFQKKTGISDELKNKIYTLAENFQKENAEIKRKTKESRKNQTENLDSQSMKSELNKLKESIKNLFDNSRKNLYDGLSDSDREKLLKFLREEIIEKVKNPNKSKSNKNLKNKINPNWFKNILYNEPQSNDFMEGYSWIDYDPNYGEIWTLSVTEGFCEPVITDGEPTEGECRGAYVYAELSDDIGTLLDSLDNTGVESFAEVSLYGVPHLSGQYCVNAYHSIEVV